MSRFRRWLGRLTGTHIFTRLPRGIDLASDLQTWLPGFAPEVVLDVGANLGQSAEQFLRWFPTARVICFEPVTTTFKELERRLGSHPRVRLARLALGAAPGSGTFRLEGPPGMHTLASRPGPGEPEALHEPVEIDTVDRFCQREGLARIGLLKIDTEGHDLAVLEGAADLLAAARIEMVMVEAGLHPENTRHVPLEALKGKLESCGYRLFGIYNQKEEWTRGRPYLRRADLVFVGPGAPGAGGRRAGGGTRRGDR
jgi:FkbM family methyltransferase